MALLLWQVFRMKVNERRQFQTVSQTRLFLIARQASRGSSDPDWHEGRERQTPGDRDHGGGHEAEVGCP